MLETISRHEQFGKLTHRSINMNTLNILLT
jgi:hypothetical protein